MRKKRKSSFSSHEGDSSPHNETQNPAANHRQVSPGVRYQIADLEKEKEQLQKEIRQAEIKLLSLQFPDDNNNDSDVTLTPSWIHGYVLSDFGFMFVDGGKMYTARCEDPKHPFKILILVRDSVVTEINLIIPHYSRLLEIEVVLSKLSEKLCPNRVLLAIQQFVHMTKFRKKVTDNLCPLHFSHEFTPRYQQRVTRHSKVCTIRARTRRQTFTECILEVQWTFVWNDTYQALAHSFFIKRASENVGVTEFVQQLHYTFFSGNEEKLLKLWNTFDKCMKIQ